MTSGQAHGKCVSSPGLLLQTEGLQRTDVASLTVVEAGSLRSRCWEAGALFEGSQGESVPCPSLSFWATSHPWFAASSLQSLPLSSCGFSLCVCVSSLLVMTPVILDLGPTLIQGGLILTTSAMALFPNKVTFGGTAG